MSKLSNSFNKKKGQDKFLTYLIGGFAFVFVAIIGVLIVNSIVNAPLKYSSFETVNSYTAFTTQEEDEYLVYWYGDNCSHCIEIKEDVLEFADSNNRGIKVYFAESGETQGQWGIIIDPDDLTSITGTPSLITVKNGVIVDIAKGKTEVVNTLNAIDNNTFNDLN